LAEVTPRLAASAIVLRDAVERPPGHSPYEVLMIRRHEGASFVPNAWVFPGGMADPADHEVAREINDATLLGAMRIAAARELFEESGVWLGRQLEDSVRKRKRLLAGSVGFRELLAESPIDFRQFVWTSHWITPAAAPKRFDTYFFLALAPADGTASIAGEEAVEITWATPERALADLKMIFPTIRNLEAIRGFDDARSLIASRHGVEIPTLMPRIVDGKIVLP